MTTNLKKIIMGEDPDEFEDTEIEDDIINIFGNEEILPRCHIDELVEIDEFESEYHDDEHQYNDDEIAKIVLHKYIRDTDTLKISNNHKSNIQKTLTKQRNPTTNVCVPFKDEYIRDTGTLKLSNNRKCNIRKMLDRTETPSHGQRTLPIPNDCYQKISQWLNNKDDPYGLRFENKKRNPVTDESVQFSTTRNKAASIAVPVNQAHPVSNKRKKPQKKIEVYKPAFDKAFQPFKYDEKDFPKLKSQR